MKKIKLNKRDVVALVVIAVIVVASFLYVSYKQIQYYRYAREMENLYTKNENPVFCIDKIVTYSSANAIDNSKGKTMQDLNICQFTDMAIYIDNLVDIKELVQESDAMGVSTEETNDEASRKIKERTIKELYIDNIQIKPASSKGVKTLLYKSPLSFGKFKSTIINENANEDSEENSEENIETTQTNEATNNDTNTNTNTTTEATNTTAETTNAEDTNTTTNEAVDLLANPENIDLENENEENTNQTDKNEYEEQPERIDFEIVSTNVDNERNDYTKPVFYSDCSNPITLGYLNRNIVTGYAVSTQNTQIKFDGSILQSVGVSLEDLGCELSFDIHMKNNLDQQFTCSIGLDIPISSQNNSIFNGYMYGMQDNLKEKYRFFKN